MRIFIFFLIFNINSFAHSCYPEKIKFKRLVVSVEKSIKKGEYFKALKLISKSDESLIFSLLKSEVLWRQGQFFKSEKFALKTILNCPEKFPKAYYFLGEIAFKRKDYINANKYLSKAISLGIKDPFYSDAIMLHEKSNILANILNNPVSFNPSIVSGISSVNDEYLPIISPDQNYAFFTRRSTLKNHYSLTESTIEQFTVSVFVDSTFSSGLPLEFPFNQESNEGGASLSIDNKVLYFTKCIRNSSGYNNCDIFYVIKNKNGWSNIFEFSKNISRPDSWESQPTLSSNGKKIIFASDRVGGYGKMDLYEINFENGVWSSPKNLGPTINSSEYEKSPFLHTDGKTLFFASTNFPSLGGFDIFFSRKDSLGNWQKPVNIGYPINTVFDEISLFVSTDGNNAYFASNNLDGVGGWDVYSFPLYEEARPERVLFLQGMLLDENKNILDDVVLEVKNITTKEVKIINIDSGGYTAAITLSKEDDVLISIKKSNFAFNSTYISHEDSSFFSPSRVDFQMQSLEEGRSFNIDNIYFDNNSFEVKEATREILIEFVSYLELNNRLVIEINGFTDNVGDSQDNQLLSEKRARAVRDIIVELGVSSDRVSYNGFGESFPVYSNNTNEGRAKNRRTEFKVVRR